MMDRSERDLVRASIGQLLGSSTPSTIAEGLLASGWTDLLDDEAEVACSELALEQGRTLTAGPSLDLVLLHAAGLPVDAATGAVLPVIGRRLVAPAQAQGTGLAVDGLVLAGHERAKRFLLHDGERLVTVEGDALRFEPIGGADPDLGLQRASGQVEERGVAAVGSGRSWDDVVATGRRFLAAELIGVAGRMLDDTVTYVLERHQFGKPIASFQSVKHRLADVRVANSAARAGLATAWADGTPASAMAAKALAGRAHRLATTHCHQVHGGIAFTVEHGFHRFIRRGQVLDGLLGSADQLVRELGHQLLASHAVPRTPQLPDPGGRAS
jgi:hypothetical protein